MEEKIFSPNGIPINKKVFDALFNNGEVNTYEEIPEMIRLVSKDVSNSEYDTIKSHSLCYHVRGMIDIIEATKKAIKEISYEFKIYDINPEDEFDNDYVNKYMNIIKEIDSKKCLHTNNRLIEELDNGYFKLKCNDCDEEFIDG